MTRKKQKALSRPPNVESASGSDENAVSLFNIVGIGASAGGLEAFEEFFQNMPADSGMAFVLVPHLDPSHSSLITEILQRSTSMPVIEAKDQIQVDPNNVYVIPPNRDMEIFHGKLQLSIPCVPRGQRMPIDAFLRSLAEDQKEKAIGIILSGTGTDGTLGLRAVHGMGGVTLVQDPETARYEGMPLSAIKSGFATVSLSVAKMPEFLLAGPRKIIADRVETQAVIKPETGLSPILMILRSITGNDFSLYKQSTIGRRIERRMLQNNIKDTNEYIRFLKETPNEVHALFKELLINVTSFFRDPDAFFFLEEGILKSMVNEKLDNYIFRIWVAGCATGEEGYSVAIIMHELMDKLHKAFKVQIYCTDLDEDAIAIARAGVYTPNIAQDLTPERLRRYFIKDDVGFRVKKEIREMVVFAVQNVIKDPPFTKLDLLCCRNLLIYLKPELQDKLIPQFHYALKPDGVLFLSPSESIGAHRTLFNTINRKWKCYRAIPNTTSAHALLTQSLAWDSNSVGHKTKEENIKDVKDINFAELTREALLNFYAPASVITDYKGDILYIHGETGKYLRPAPGKPTLNVIEMAREGLVMELRAGIYTAANEKLLILNRLVEVKTNGGFTPVNVSIRSMKDPEISPYLLLISFQDVADNRSKLSRKRSPKRGDTERINELEQDLLQMKANYQASIEELQASNEELKSTNEEMQSTNEELQSTNEELETSKEELQSVNEELVTVNSELQGKIEQLAGMQNDMKNLLDNINVGIIFLDSHLIIRRFTREAKRIYRLVNSDIGRPLNDIKTVFEGDDLLTAAQTVLDTLIPYEHEIYIGDEMWVLARIQPYRTLESLIDGVVMTFTDITSRIKGISAHEALTLSKGIVNSISEPLVVLNPQFKIISASQSFYREFQLKPEETKGHEIYEIANASWNIAELHQLLENVIRNDLPVEGILVERSYPGIGRRSIKMNASRMIGKASTPQMILLSMEICE